MDETKLERYFEIPMIIFGILVLPVLYIQLTSTIPLLRLIAYVIDILIWLAFVFEFVAMISATKDKRNYVKTNWLNLAIILLTPPLPLRGLAGLEGLRILRILRVLRVFVVMGRGTKGFKKFYAKNSINYVLYLTVILVFICGFIFSLFEKGKSFFDGIWWAIETVSTVGYGDIAPITPAGRALGIVLIFLGIGFMSMLTAAISAYFVEKDSNREMKQILEKLDMLGKEIEELKKNK
ncbi:MAG: Voltage-gated potassium channel [Candidatus Methanofastidiosum methylothiophilum]|uniref:Voltage-gated potassium channel n=1 Tax=Candidatus Methanofastidiosum methylothiophilum TaxID=1705564 RepID=A0A150J2H9_9EURY|nr:MAG: Voltage-gated potassium channel [Candidatus Methanofastidiosum methylthiophilus]KYC48789.1 MAG: Voltage-gated potassium channel [Candidatus Methanofastidiosum methylthiophilus]KYC51437.1 MAG: Voltage-gated potassium channel [Candidatus Methanofastidiosum methylthiophilus]